MIALPKTSAGIPVAPAGPKLRVEWVDYAKGICIFFVVMLHVNDLVQERMGTKGWLENFVVFARPFRMPDFFLIAGLFLSNAIKRPWRLYLDRKVIHFLYFYGLWMTMEFLVVDARFAISHHEIHVGSLVLGYLRLFINPKGPLWFIHMLPIFFVVTRLLCRAPWWVMWLAAVALHSTQLKTGWTVPDYFALRFVFFYTGYKAAPFVFRLASFAYDHPPIAIAYLVCWGIVNGLVVAAGWAGLPVISLALGYIGAIAVIVTAVLLSKQRWTEPLRYIGEHSLIVYLGDFTVSMIVVGLLLPYRHDAGWLAMIATLLTVAGTLGLWRLVMATPGRFMYRRPKWLGCA